MSISRAITGISKPETAFSNLSQPPPSLIVPQDVPTSSPSALTFFKNINENDIKYSLFDETLATFTDSKSEMGVYQVRAKHDCYKGEEVISVEAKSYGKIDNVKCSTEITAYLNEHLQTIHQDLYETIHLEQGPLERITIIDKNFDGYLVKKSVKSNGKVENKERLFDFPLMNGYVSEGCNIILQRIMLTKGLPDFFDVVSFDSDTNLCLCSYIDLPSTTICIGPKSTKCYGLERKIHSLIDIPVTWHAYFLPDGHLVSRAQVGSPIFMKVKLMPDLIKHDEYIPKPEIPVKQLDWRQDVQLASMFTDRKEELVSDYQKYCRDNPEVQHLLADFVQSLLIHKPKNTVNFASAFFATFSNRFTIDPPLVSLDNTDMMLSEQ